MIKEVDVSRFLDKENRIKAWPSKMQAKLDVLCYLVEKFEYGRFYTEKEVNAIIESWHTFGDYFLLRRGMIEYRLMTRERDGSKYWRQKQATQDNDYTQNPTDITTN